MPVDLADLRRRMAQLPDEQLLNVVTQQRADYQPMALELADAEVRRRGLSQYAQSLGTPTTSGQTATQPAGRQLRGGDIIAKGCLSIIGLVVYIFWASRIDGFDLWFVYGLSGWFIIPAIIAGMFGAVGWLLQKVKPRP